MQLRSTSRLHAPAVGALSLLALVLTLRRPADPPGPASQGNEAGGLVTLYAADDLASSIDLRTGRHGGRVVDGEIVLDQAQLAYDVFAEGMLSFGFSTDEVVGLVDLGPLQVGSQPLPTDDSLKFPISVFHGLRLDGQRLVFQRAGGKFTRLDEGDEIFKVVPRGLRHAQPVVGNTYVVRFQRLRDGERANRMAKILVIDHRPGESLTLRWAPLGVL